MAYNASDRRNIRTAEKAARIAESQRTEFTKAAMSTLQGRAWFYALLDRCHIFADPFTGDALREAYSKGERNIGLSIYLDIVTHCPDEFVRMMREAHEKELIDERRNAERDASEARIPDPASPEYPGGQDSGWDVEEPARLDTDTDRWADYGEGRRR